jgi:hypothetical protein
MWASNVLPPQPPTPDFNLAANPQNLTIPQGNSQNLTITVTSINGFNETVRFYVVDPVDEVTTSFDPNRVTPSPNGQANSTLTVSVSSTAILGNYTFTVVGKSTSRTHSIGINLEITAASGSQQHLVGVDAVASSTDVNPEEGQDFEIYYKTSNDNGLTWSREIQFTDNLVTDTSPSIFQLQNGTTMVFWQSKVSGNDDIWYKTTTDGVSWSGSIQLTTNSSSDTSPKVTATKDGKLWVVWASDRLGDPDIFYKTYDGSSWSDDTLLAPGASSDFELQPAIVQAIDDNILIFWAGTDTATNATATSDIYYANSTDNGEHWSNRTVFYATSYEDTSPAVMRAVDTKILVVWASDRSEEIEGSYEIHCRTSLAGDVNNDGIVNVDDLTIVAFAYGTYEGELYYDLAADINRDGIVDMKDIRVVSYYFDET